MTYTHIVKEGATADALEAYLYDEEKQEGLGDKFINELRKRYKQIGENPQHYIYVSADREKTFRDVKIHGFPYVIIYDFSGEEVTVYAIRCWYKNSEDLYG